MRTNRRKHPQDALRWLMGVFVSAVIASAVTSAIFLLARPEPPTIDPLDAHGEHAAEVSQLLAPQLEAAARARLEEDLSGQTPNVEVVYRTEPPPADEEVPMFAPDDNMLMKGAPVPWHLKVVSQTGERKLGRIVDIRDGGSLTNPGYLGIVEVAVETTTRELAVSGELPLKAPDGFQVITPAKYTELEGTQQVNVRLASAKTDERRYVYESWAPATPPPQELPEEVRREFNQAIAQCTTSQPVQHVSTERLMFFYSLRERKWMPRP